MTDTQIYDELVPASLRLVSDSLDDVEALRKATANRLQAATSTWVDKKTGVVRGLGLDERDSLVAGVAALDETLRTEEHRIVLQLNREIRKTIFGAWLKEQKGIGEKTLARLLAAIGDPYIRYGVEDDEDGQSHLTQNPRSLQALWAYSGLAVDNGRARRVPAGASQADVFACGKTIAKTRAYLVAEGLVKSGVRVIDPDLDANITVEVDTTSMTKTEAAKAIKLANAERGYPVDNREAVSRYGEIYLDRRSATLGRIHTSDCAPCKRKTGAPWSGAHQQADALRILSKQVLKDLWLLAREHHTGIPTTAPIVPARTAHAEQESIAA